MTTGYGQWWWWWWWRRRRRPGLVLLGTDMTTPSHKNHQTGAFSQAGQRAKKPLASQRPQITIIMNDWWPASHVHTTSSERPRFQGWETAAKLAIARRPRVVILYRRTVSLYRIAANAERRAPLWADSTTSVIYALTAAVTASQLAAAKWCRQAEHNSPHGGPESGSFAGLPAAIKLAVTAGVYYGDPGRRRRPATAR